MSFRIKCLNKIDSLKSQGTAIVFVSHSEIDIAHITDRCLLLDHGQTMVLETTQEAMQHYRNQRLISDHHDLSLESRPRVDHASGVEILGLSLATSTDGHAAISGESCVMELMVDVIQPLASAAVELRFWRSGEQLVAVVDSSSGGSYFSLDPGVYRISVDIPACVLMPDFYLVTGGVTSNGQIHAWSTELAKMRVVATRELPRLGMAFMPASVSVSPVEPIEELSTCLDAPA